MSSHNISEIALKTGLDIASIEQIFNTYELKIPMEKNKYIIDAFNFVLTCKIAKVLSQDISPSAKNKKIKAMIQAGKNNITISDVALEAGVSIGAISRVVNNREGNVKISERTKNKILNAVDELGYKANPFATALRKKQSGIIGVVIRDINDPFLRQLFKEVQKLCNFNGYDILMSNARHEAETAEKQINLMMNQLFDGVIILGDMDGDINLLRGLSTDNLPVVSLDGRANKYISTVKYDDVYGTKLAFNYLYKLGHRNIAFIGNTKHTSVKERLSTFLKQVKKNNMNYSSEMIFTASTALESAIHTKSILDLSSRPTAIFCSSDLLAQGAVGAILQSGLKIPNDISVIGYDDIEELNDIYISLTTLRQPVTEAVNIAVTELLRQITCFSNGKEIEPINYEIKPELIIRSSCSEPNSR